MVGKATRILLIVFLITMVSLNKSAAQNVGINSSGAAPNQFAILDVESSTMGMLIPRMTTTDRSNFGTSLGATEEGMTVYDLDTDSYWLWDGAAWVEFDMDATNEYNTVLNLSGTTLELTDGGGTLTQDLNSLVNDTDWAMSPGHVYNVDDNVGIGTTAPTAKLDVRGGNVLFNENGNDNDVRMESLNRTEAFFLDASKDVVFMGDNWGDYQNGSTIGTQTVDYVANMDNGAISGTAVGIGSIEYLLDHSSETTINNRFSPSTDGGEDLGGTSRRWNEVFAINGTINTSDKRDKKNIENLNYGLNEIMELNPVSYEWKEGVGQIDDVGKRKIGLIAQEVNEVVNEVVKKEDIYYEEDPYKEEVKEAQRWGIYYSDLIPVLVKGIQEQQKVIEKQKKKNQALENRLDQMEKRIRQLEDK